MNCNSIKIYQVFFLLFASLLFLPGRMLAQSRTFTTSGVFDARQMEASTKRIALNGNWDFYWNALLSPKELKGQPRSSMLVPSIWNDHRNLRNFGHATYSIRLILPRGEKWALELPQLYNSYVVFIGDSAAASNGIPGTTKELNKPEWKPQYVVFTTRGDTTRVTIQLSNYHHNFGGIREPIYLGRAESIVSHFETALTGIFVEVCVLAVLALSFIGLYFFGRQDRLTLYFALLCLSWGLREMFSDLYPAATLLPGLNWFVQVRIEYLSLFMVIFFGMLFIGRLFRDLSNPVFKYLVGTAIVLFAGFCLVAPVAVFTKWLTLYLVTSTIVLIYVATIVVRAMIQEKTGAWFLTSGLILSVLAFSYDLIAYKGIIGNHILFGSICHMLIFLCCALGVLQHLRMVMSPENRENILRYKDLYREG